MTKNQPLAGQLFPDRGFWIVGVKKVNLYEAGGTEQTTESFDPLPAISKSLYMPVTTYHIRIKKNYAADIIKDLQKLDAVELLEEPAIPNWQKKEVRKRLKDVQKKPAQAISWNDGLKKIKQLAK